ncbi:MAG: ribonuclease VapC [Actinomycetota bacterium]|nr:ribonuclease VapC [Actinomycetota bacterium]HPY26035.1 type II toxin-antitoxin system VapC family toxin [Mycobacterium sp.]
MIVDSSALIALIQHESSAEQVAAALSGARSPAVGAATLAETLIVLTARQGPVARTVLDRLRSEVNLAVVDLTAEHAYAAHRAYQRFGRGRHPAGLNFGDCLTYATAQISGEPLLAIGNDFPRTDLEFGAGIVGYWPTPAAQ